MKNFNRYITLVFCLIIASPLMAQTNDNSNLDNAEVVIEKNSSYEMQTMGREYDKIQRIEKKVKPQPQNYELELIGMDLNDSLPKQLPAVIDDHEEKKYYSKYIRVGYGNFITPYIEGGVNSNRNPDFDYGVNFLHRSSQEGSVSRKLSAGSHNAIDGFGKYFSDYGTTSFSLGYDRVGTHFYGVEGDETQISQDSIKQIINNFGFKIGHEMPSYLTGNSYSLKGDLFFDYTADKFNASEMEIGVDINGEYEMLNDAKIHVNLIGAFNQYKNQTTADQSIDINRSWVKLGGVYEATFDELYIKAGAKIAYSADSSSFDKGFYFYPDVFVEYTIAEDELAAFLEVKGDLNIVDYKALTNENPWVSNDLTLLHENKLIDIRLGADAIVGSDIGIRGSIGYAIVQNMGFFVNDPSDISRFLMAYATEGNTGVFNLNVAGSWTQREWMVTASTDWNMYSIGDDMIAEPYHKPLAVNNVSVVYKYLSNWTFKANIYNKIGLKALEVDAQTAEQNTVSLPMIFDMNLSAQYKINENLDAFLLVNNLFAQTYENYYRYNVKGFQLMAGVGYRF
ncbi:TonB-dependent receptor [Flammeovirga aprica]|uniref:TonB-dependent receptor n=1 Tax=Flammeovirga aprica JL-4 TaxID=694437 RepID=A0A7X9RVW7_9BACT|nr:TonB-dependent receptor [Flammeovirga aprica]NME69665.1 TonB-dependent receptor [Flammeovirga aprica JL-4]